MAQNPGLRVTELCGFQCRQLNWSGNESYHDNASAYSGFIRPSLRVVVDNALHPQVFGTKREHYSVPQSLVYIWR